MAVADVWIVVGCGGGLALLGGGVIWSAYRRASLGQPDMLGPGAVNGMPKVQPSATRAAVCAGMVKGRCETLVAETGGGPLVDEGGTRACGTMDEEAWCGMWEGIAEVEPKASAAGSLMDPMLDPDQFNHRPSECLYCGLVPNPDFVARDVGDGVMYLCPGCDSIAYYEAKGLVQHRHNGKTYHVPEGKPFVPPVRKESLGGLLRGDAGVDAGFFRDFLEHPGAV